MAVRETTSKTMLSKPPNWVRTGARITCIKVLNMCSTYGCLCTSDQVRNVSSRGFWTHRRKNSSGSVTVRDILTGSSQGGKRLRNVIGDVCLSTFREMGVHGVSLYRSAKASLDHGTSLFATYDFRHDLLVGPFDPSLTLQIWTSFFEVSTAWPLNQAGIGNCSGRSH